MKNKQVNIILASAAAAVALWPLTGLAGTTINTAGPVQNGQSNGGTGNPALNNAPAVISLSGQTALRTFTSGTSPTLLQPGTSITLYNGIPSVTGGITSYAPTVYTAPTGATTAVQLASKLFGNADDLGSGGPSAPYPTQNHSALRVEWHEQGSLDGFYDLINDQIGYTAAQGPISNYNNRGPSVANPTWVNGTSFTTTATSSTSVKHSINISSGASVYDTYSTAVYDRSTGYNKLNGQNRIQIAIGEYGPENFAFSGTASVNKAPNTAGYGLGNPALKAASSKSGQGVSNSRQSFQPDSIANLSTDKIDPQTGTNYTVGPWNTAGVNNIDSQQFAATAVTISANPGTGLRRLNLSDSQWLQTAGRLANGAEFNYVSRVANTGQRNVLAINTGVDPTWAVGENDGGDTGTSAQATAQKAIGPNIRFSGKTSGTESRNAIANSRFGVGALSLAEANGASGAAPVRTLEIAFNDLTDPQSGGTTDYSKFLRPTFNSFVNLDYKAILISHYNTIKAPNAAFAGASSTTWAGLTSAQTGIKGDVGASGLNPTSGNVRSFINNVTGSVATAASGLLPSSVSNPADGLIANGFFVPGLLNYKRIIDGGALTPNNLNATQLQLQADTNANYPNIFTTDNLFGSYLETKGSGATYGAIGTVSAVNGSIPITAKDASGNSVSDQVFGPRGNYLAGNFNQNGTRDYSAIKEGVNAALSLAKSELAFATPGKSSIFTSDGGQTNNTVISPLVGTPGWSTSANTKGDLIVLGDINSDGAYDGKDVYLLSKGASLSDNGSTDQLTTASGPTFSDQLRNPNAKLNKNAALDYANAQTTAVVGNADGANAARAFLRSSGRSTLTGNGTVAPSGATTISVNTSANTVTYTFDPNGDNAFNKLDVNRDGRANFYDAAIVDGFNGNSIGNLSQQLGAVLATNQNDGGTIFVGTDETTDATQDTTTDRRQVSLTDIELNDDGNINASDVTVANTALTGALNDVWNSGTSYKTGPNTITFNRTSAGTVTVPANAILQIKAGAVQVGGSQDPLSNGANRLKIDNTGSFSITAGTKNVAAIVGTGNTSVTGAGSVLNTDSVAQGTVTLSGGAVLNVRPNGTNSGLSSITELSIDSASKLDLADNDAIITGQSLASVVSKLSTGRNGGAWTGNGITSSAAAASSGQLTTLGVATASSLGASNFGGVSGLSGAEVLVKYTYYGDTNLDGQVNTLDLVKFLAGYGATNDNGSTSEAWVTGDFNFDSVVNTLDLSKFLQGYGATNDSGAPILTPSLALALAADSHSAPLAESAVAVVPEPTSLGLLAVGAMGLPRRRRNRMN